MPTPTVCPSVMLMCAPGSEPSGVADGFGRPPPVGSTVPVAVAVGRPWAPLPPPSATARAEHPVSASAHTAAALQARANRPRPGLSSVIMVIPL